MPALAQHPPRLAMGSDLVGKEHRPELAGNQVEACIGERQRLGVRLLEAH